MSKIFSCYFYITKGRKSTAKLRTYKKVQTFFEIGVDKSVFVCYDIGASRLWDTQKHTRKEKKSVVDINKLRSLMVLKGYSQKSLVAEMNKRGFKTTENTFSAKMKGKSQFDCADADIICDILEVNDSASKAEIFLA